MTEYLNRSGLNAPVRQGGVSAFAFATFAFVAVGAVAWIGLESVQQALADRSSTLALMADDPENIVEQNMADVISSDQKESDEDELSLASNLGSATLTDTFETATDLTPIDRSAEPLVPATSIGTVTHTAAIVRTPLVIEPVTITPKAMTPIVEIIAEFDCVDALRDYASAQVILFGTGSAELPADGLETLRTIGQMAEDCPAAAVHVAGHSDSLGTDIVNLALSWQRADNAVAALTALGIDANQFEPVGFGARVPLAQGDSSDEQLNRRVEFQVFKAVGQEQ